MTKDFAVLADKARTKAVDAINLLQASLAGYHAFDPAREYSAVEREPCDAVCDRHIRAVETAIKFFRSLELYLYAEPSETLRDLGLYTRFIELAGEVNSTMSQWVVGKIADALNQRFPSIKGSRVLACWALPTRRALKPGFQPNKSLSGMATSGKHSGATDPESISVTDR